jgi:hypothetical protein
MGVASYLKGKAKEAIVNAKSERAYNIERKLENRNQYDKGYREGQYKRGLAEGSGQIVPASRPAQSGRSSGGGARSPIKASSEIFGGFGGGIGGGIAFGGFGDEPRQHAAPPMRTTQISKSGKVTIQEPYERKQPIQKAEDPFGSFWGAAPAGNSKKGEKHPYDLF